ncbi:MAG: hypothetical protein JWO74_4590 [Solirubrobacterales bacterium]|nr:hypothetical protein [Solirubrobacterales bacterium]
MARRRAAALVVATVSVAATVASGCGGHGGSGDPSRTPATPARIEGDVSVARLTYSASDGGRLPAVLVTPRGFSPRGCLIWQNGLNERKEDPAEIWHRAARLGLAVLTVDLPGDGIGAGAPGDIAAVDPRHLAALIDGWVSDLGRAVADLEGRPECRRNIGYVGLGLGGMIGSLLAGRDPRIHATVIVSTPPTWRSLIAVGDPTAGVEQLRTADRVLAPLDPVSWIPRISPQPAMVLIGRDDPLVPPAEAARLVAAAPTPKRIVHYRGTDPFSAADDTGAAFQVETFLLRWLVKPTYV